VCVRLFGVRLSGLLSASELLALAHSALNPLIYGLFSVRTMRQSCGRRCQRRRDGRTSSRCDALFPCCCGQTVADVSPDVEVAAAFGLYVETRGHVGTIVTPYHFHRLRLIRNDKKKMYLWIYWTLFHSVRCVQVEVAGGVAALPPVDAEHQQPAIELRDIAAFLASTAARRRQRPVSADVCKPTSPDSSTTDTTTADDVGPYRRISASTEFQPRGTPAATRRHRSRRAHLLQLTDTHGARMTVSDY